MNNIKTRINKLIAKANDAQDKLGSGVQGGFEVFYATQMILEAELNAIDKLAGDGLVVGRSLSFGVADGLANYIVTKVRKAEVAVVHIPLWDGYQFQGVYDNGKGELCLPRAVADCQCKYTHE